MGGQGLHSTSFLFNDSSGLSCTQDASLRFPRRPVLASHILPNAIVAIFF